MRRFLVGALTSLGLAAAAAQGDAPSVSAAWARATPPQSRSAAVYLTVTGGATKDRLIGAATPAAAFASLHESRSVGGVSQMREIVALGVQPGETVTLAPNGIHLMLTELRAPLVAGQTIPLTLRFEHAGEVQTHVTVATLGASAPDGQAEMPGGMSKK